MGGTLIATMVLGAGKTAAMPALGFGISLAAAWLILTFPFSWLPVIRFAREHRAAYKAGEKKMEQVASKDRWIWATDIYGDSLRKKRAKKPTDSDK